MKFVVGWRGLQGRSAKKRRRDQRRVLNAFVRWLTPDDQVIHQFVLRVDGGGGFAVIETDRAAGLLESVAKFSPWFEFEVFPVVDVADGGRCAGHRGELARLRERAPTPGEATRSTRRSPGRSTEKKAREEEGQEARVVESLSLFARRHDSRRCHGT